MNFETKIIILCAVALIVSGSALITAIVLYIKTNMRIIKSGGAMLGAFREFYDNLRDALEYAEEDIITDDDLKMKIEDLKITYILPYCHEEELTPPPNPYKQ